MIDLKRVWEFYQPGQTRKQRFSEGYKNRLIGSNKNPSRPSQKLVPIKSLYTLLTKTNKKRVSGSKKKKQRQDVTFAGKQLQKSKQQIVHTFREIETVRQLKFLRAAKKLFRAIDVSGKGYIKDINASINKIMPESALYFLGSFFQKMRKWRVQINEDHFISECENIRKQSNREDVEAFVSSIEQMGSSNNLNSHFKASSGLQQRHQLLNQSESKVEVKIQICQSISVYDYETPKYFFPENEQRQLDGGNSYKKANQSRQVYRQRCPLRERINSLNQQLNHNNKKMVERGIFAGKEVPQFNFKLSEVSLQIQEKTGHTKPKHNPTTQNNRMYEWKENQLVAKAQIRSAKFNKPRNSNSQNDGKIQQLSSRVQDFIKKNAERIALSQDIRNRL